VPHLCSTAVYLQFTWGVPLPHSLELGVPCPLCYVSFVFFFFSAACLLFSLVFFSLFSLGGGSVCPGGYADLTQGCLWEYCMPFSSPGGLLLPSRLGAGIWQWGSPPGFSIYHGVGMLCAGWEHGGVGFFPLLGGFSCKVHLQSLSKILL
jgi:hypothetical protein